MSWAPIATAVLSAAGALMSYKQGKSAAKQQEILAMENRRVAEENARREEAENAERQRRFEAQNQQDEARARALAAASGLSLDDDVSSLALSLAAQRDENRKQEKWEKDAGASRASIIRQQGQVALMGDLAKASYMKNEAKSYLGKAGGSLFTAGAETYKYGQARDWWT